MINHTNHNNQSLHKIYINRRPNSKKELEFASHETKLQEQELEFALSDTKLQKVELEFASLELEFAAYATLLHINSIIKLWDHEMELASH